MNKKSKKPPSLDELQAHAEALGAQIGVFLHTADLTVELKERILILKYQEP